uniref:Uncharacterized protein n=1 Tax=Anguilla anguilla TaxID=7936 RepID=A0A0E9R519_ANGAN
MLFISFSAFTLGFVSSVHFQYSYYFESAES